MRFLSLVVLVALVACSAQDAKDAATKAANDAVDKTKQAAKDATDQALAAGKDKAVELGNDALAAGKDKAASLYEDLTGDGQLSKSASAWISEQAEDGGNIETVIRKGVQIAPVALEVAKVANEAVDEDTAIEPIFQDVDDPGEVDKAIAAMPRTEVIDGLTVGFRQLGSIDNSKSVEERAYLVTWRHEKRLVGFIYRSKKTIDLDLLAKETPRLVKLIQQAAQD